MAALKNFRLAQKNLSANRLNDYNDGCICGQAVNKRVSQLRLGRFSLGYNGCGAIAAYNSMRLNNKKVCLSEVIYSFETLGIIRAWGLFGSYPKRLGRFLKSRGVDFAYTDRLSTAEQYAQKGSILILSYWVKRRNPFKGMHFVTVKCLEDGVVVYNAYNNFDKPLLRSSISELLCGKKLIACYKIV